MGDLTFNNFPYVDGFAINSADVGNNLYDADDPRTSLETINGRLGNNNREAAPYVPWEVSTEHIQHGALSGGNSTGASGNLDYFNEVFGGYTTGAADTSLFIPIPGASLTFYLPYAPTVVVFNWSVSWANANETASGNIGDIGKLRLFLDGSVEVGQTIDCASAGPGGTYPAGARGGPQFDRIWSGVHMETGMTAGWHDVSIRLVSEQKYTRVRVRSLTFVYFL